MVDQRPGWLWFITQSRQKTCGVNGFVRLQVVPDDVSGGGIQVKNANRRLATTAGSHRLRPEQGTARGGHHPKYRFYSRDRRCCYNGRSAARVATFGTARSAVVAGDNHQGVLALSRCINRRQDLANAVIEFDAEIAIGTDAATAKEFWRWGNRGMGRGEGGTKSRANC